MYSSCGLIRVRFLLCTPQGMFWGCFGTGIGIYDVVHHRKVFFCWHQSGADEWLLVDKFFWDIFTFTFSKKNERALSLSILTMSGPGKFPRVESN